VLGRIGQRSQLLGMAAGFFPGGNRTEPFTRPRPQGTRLVSGSPAPRDLDGAEGRTPGKRNKGKQNVIRTASFEVIEDDEDSQSGSGSEEEDEEQ
jgi:hypothetical protein